jgi:acetate kinase
MVKICLKYRTGLGVNKIIMTLVFNVGSTSIKYSLFDETNAKVWSEKIENPKDFSPKDIINILSQKGFIGSVLDIQTIVHRVVFGGSSYTQLTDLTNEVIADLESLSEIAPLHNPPTLNIIKQIKKIYPELVQKAVFDTSFHQTLEPKTFLYGVPYQYYEQFAIRKYGFHGISHGYIAKKVAQLEDKNNLRIISCHLGGGCSVCSIKNGKSTDISMGFSPEEGLMMATRSGIIGAGALTYLGKKLNKSSEEILEILNRESGLLGVSGISGDMREILTSYDPQAKLAIEMYCLNIAKYIGSFVPQLGGLDVLVFTGAVGEGSSVIREKICEYLGYLDLFLCSKANSSSKVVNQESLISSNHSKVKVWVIPADEEGEIVGVL